MKTTIFTLVTLAFLGLSTTYGQVGIGTQTPDASAILDVESTEKGFLPPRVADPENDIANPATGLWVYNTTEKCLEFYNGTQWFNICNPPVVAPADQIDPLPAGMEITNLDGLVFVASVYDDNYLPYAAPTGPATTSTNVDPNGTTDPLVDVEGVIGALGSGDELKFVLRYTATGTLSYPALEINRVVSKDLIEGGTEDIVVTFSYEAGTTVSGDGTIEATISAATTFTAKQLDVNAGIGDDNLGVFMALFDGIPIDGDTPASTGEVQLRDIAGIPDRNIGNGADFLYMPITDQNGNVWLNNNLGATYNNLGSTAFNPTQQANSLTDNLAYGSLYQWGRLTDGHQLINRNADDPHFTSGDGGSTSSNPDPGTTQFIKASSNWYTGTNPNDLWKEDGTGVNNPCPVGFRVPTEAEWSTVAGGDGVSTIPWTGSNDAFSSDLALPAAGFRSLTTGATSSVGSRGRYWSSTVLGTDASHLSFLSSSAFMGTNARAAGYSVRCIKD